MHTDSPSLRGVISLYEIPLRFASSDQQYCCLTGLTVFSFPTPYLFLFIGQLLLS